MSRNFCHQTDTESALNILDEGFKTDQRGDGETLSGEMEWEDRMVDPKRPSGAPNRSISTFFGACGGDWEHIVLEGGPFDKVEIQVDPEEVDCPCFVGDDFLIGGELKEALKNNWIDYAHEVSESYWEGGFICKGNECTERLDDLEEGDQINEYTWSRRSNPEIFCDCDIEPSAIDKVRIDVEFSGDERARRLKEAGCDRVDTDGDIVTYECDL